MRLATFILDNIEPILKQWEDFARSLQPGRLMTVAALRDDAEEMLRFIAADIETVQSQAQQEQKSVGRGPQLADGDDSAAHDHGKARAVDHFTFSEMVSEYRALRAAVTHMWLDSAGVDSESVNQLVRFNEAVDQVLAESVVRFAATLENESDLFTASIGHDLRNPLNSIVSSSEMLAQSSLLPDAERAAAKRIASSALRMAGMLAELQDFSRSRLGGLLHLSLEHVSVAQICRDVIAEIAAMHLPCTLRFAESGDTGAVVDRKRIGQLISNLVGNAVQHGSPFGVISVSVQGDKEHVRVEVHNEGPKIDRARLEDIFEPLHRAASEPPRASGSLGLGLYIVRRVTVAHGGTVSVTSTEADGTTFVVVIPRTPKK
ncbi:sensor histidine kinase [Azoarcus sp. KH32C]|uniref:sensor histidine kinase n=1 Tax=Azoarcus sp. KH32C TaxID=748247 RepID=UPI0002385D0B|nr:sensor histidine kinase [Azoarcus sp. KH32C]BAL27510.1 sensor histidine kinase protein [Azoarcus sp. KH32C]